MPNLQTAVTKRKGYLKA